MFENLTIGKPYLVETTHGNRIGFLAQVGATYLFRRKYVCLCQNESLEDSFSGLVIKESDIKAIHELKPVGSK